MLGALNKFGWEAKLKYLSLVLLSPFKVKLETGGWWVLPRVKSERVCVHVGRINKLGLQGNSSLLTFR